MEKPVVSGLTFDQCIEKLRELSALEWVPVPEIPQPLRLDFDGCMVDWACAISNRDGVECVPHRDYAQWREKVMRFGVNYSIQFLIPA